ncbi:hypothetical protein [Streptomyces sp. NPDC016845]|uniref:hypothetical protein n=1 Tax=Streptomyces sp. NPDC016845 TaxID=3364972 RepID=UPI00379062FA
MTVFFAAGRQNDVAGRAAGRSGTAGAFTGTAVFASGRGAAGPVNVCGTCGCRAATGARAEGAPWAGYFATHPFSSRWQVSRRGDFGSEQPFS